MNIWRIGVLGSSRYAATCSKERKRERKTCVRKRERKRGRERKARDERGKEKKEGCVRVFDSARERERARGGRGVGGVATYRYLDRARAAVGPKHPGPD